MENKIRKLVRDNLSLLIFIVLMVCFRSALADWNVVPTGSMKPTIVEGDRIFVNKMAYDIRIPLTGIFIKRLANPERGDIVTFDSKHAGETLVKRVIGLPGDVVQLYNNQLIINDIAASYTILEIDGEHMVAEEQLGSLKHKIRISRQLTEYSRFGPVIVPEEMYLVLGDNRDNSADSRVHGFIPRGEIRGRSKMIVLSLDTENFYLPRSNRFFKDMF